MKKTRAIRLSLYGLWLAAIAALFALHAVHLRADFPNDSPWMDYSKYTDEGWYGKAAIAHYVLGSWYVHGDFNPSVALPVLPALELALFRFTGVSLVAARLLVLAIFALNLLLAYLVLRTQVSRPAALFAVTLLVSNAFLYAFSRLAILEQPMTLFLLASWLLALRLPEMTGKPRRTTALAAIGLLLCLGVLTKTTALFLLPSTLFLIWRAYGYKLRQSLQPLLIVALSAIVPFGSYYLLFVHPRYAYDYQYLFAANVWNQPDGLWGYLAAFWYALHGALWIDPWLCLLALGLLLASAIFLRGLWRNPLLIASLIACAGYVFFIGWHNNMQPRYYQLVAYPLVFVIALATQALLTAKTVIAKEKAAPFEGTDFQKEEIAVEGDGLEGDRSHKKAAVEEDGLQPVQISARERAALAAEGKAVATDRLTPGLIRRLTRPLAFAAIAVAAVASAANLREILYWTRHPEYTWITAARALTGYIDQHPNGNRLLLSISGDNITLVTRLPAICDDFGTWDLAMRIHSYRPGWYAAWNELDPGTLEDLHTQYSLEPVASFHAFDDPDRNRLILYKLHPLPAVRQHYNQAIEEEANAGR
jgi:hypothetical protein